MSLFFILSGFVLAISLTRSPRSFGSYFKSRIFRIYPVYFFAALATIPWLFGSEKPNVLLGALLITTNILMIQAWFPSTFHFWNNGASWSISVEFFFYAVLPLVILLTVDLSNRRLFHITVISVLASAVVGLAYVAFPPTVPLIVFYSAPVYRLPEFLVGVTSGLMFANNVRIRSPKFVLVVALIVLALALSFPQLTGTSYITAHYIAVPSIAITIFASACIGSVPGPIFRPIVWMGRISYSFYAFQSLTIYTLISLRTQLAEFSPIFKNNWGIFVLAFATTTILAAISHNLLEVKFRDILELRFNKTATPKKAY